MLTKNTANKVGAMAIALSVLIVSCHKDDLQNKQSPASETDLKAQISENNSNPDEAMLNDKALSKGGYVYTQSNDAAQNSIIIYKQAADGNLSWYKSVPSAGKGTGAGLGSQGALVVDEQHQYLYAVNAGDNSISSFLVNNDGNLKLAHTVSSEGVMPVSVTTFGQWLYVVNAGSSSICGFWIGNGGTLTKINGSVQKLSSDNAGPAEISFQPTGKVLYVTEKNTNKIATFKLDKSGAAQVGNFINSVGQTPYGFAFAKHKNYMIVSNAAGGATGAGSCTSYATNAMGNTQAVNGAVQNFSAAPCWVATTLHGRFAYVSNTASNTISTYYVSPFGSIYLVFFTKAKTGKTPSDVIVSTDNRYVYNINSTDHSIGMYKRGPLGTLISLGHTTLPDHAVGLAAY